MTYNQAMQQTPLKKDWFYWSMWVLGLIAGLQLYVPAGDTPRNLSPLVILVFTAIGIIVYHTKWVSSDQRSLFEMVISPVTGLIGFLTRKVSSYSTIFKILAVIGIVIYLALPPLADWNYRGQYCDSKLDNPPPICYNHR